MKQLSDRLRGNIQSYQLAVLRPFARDWLDIAQRDHKTVYRYSESFLQTCRQLLGIQTIGQFVSYGNSFLGIYEVVLEIPIFHSAINHLHLLQEYAIIEAGNELNGEISDNCRFSCTSLFEQIERDINSFEARGVKRRMFKDFKEAISEGVKDTTTIVDERGYRNLMDLYSATIIALQLSGMLCKLLRAPSIFEYICSTEGIEDAIDIVFVLRCLGGAIFLKRSDFERDPYGNIMPGSWKRLWNHLAPKEVEKFLNCI